MNDIEEELLSQHSQAQRESGYLNDNPDDAYIGNRGVDAPRERRQSLFDVGSESSAEFEAPELKHAEEREQKSEWESVDHPEAMAARDWAERKRALGFEREKPGLFKRGVRGVLGATGNALTKIGAAGAQDSYTAGKVLGGVGSAAKNAVDTTKDLSKIGQGVDAIAGLKGDQSLLEQNIFPGFNLNTIAKAEFAPGIKAPDTVKAALQDGGTLLEVAGRGITAASGRRALDFGDDKRRQYMDKRDAFTAARDEMRAKLQAGERGGGKAALKGAVQQTNAALGLGKAVNEYGIRPEYEYSMQDTADINNMSVSRTNKARTQANPSFDAANPDSKAEMEVKPGEVTFERKAGSDALNTRPDYQTQAELKAGRRAKALAAPGEALEGLGRVLDGSEHGQEAVRKGEYLKGATQATLSGARTIGKGTLGAVAAPLGLGMATSAVVDVGTIAAGGLLQAVGGGINAATGVGEKAANQRAIELRNKHYFGKDHFLKSEPASAEAAGEEKQEAELPGQEDALPSDPFFDSARGRRIAERGLRARDPLKEGDFEKGDRDAGLPQVDHGGAFKNFWHNRMKRPMQKVGQGLVKPVALLSKALGYGFGVIPLYNFLKNKKRREAIDAATNRTNNRRGGQLPADDFEMVNHPDEKQPAAESNYAQPEAQDKVLQALEGRKADAQISRVELRKVLNEQNADYESATIRRGAKSALKMEGRNLTKDNITAWQNFERRHNETRLDRQIADRKRERAKDPVTGESFLERQKREYLEWYEKKKRVDHARMESENNRSSMDAEVSGSEGDVDSLDGEKSSRASDDVSGVVGDPLSEAQEALRGRQRIEGRGVAGLVQAARLNQPMAAISEVDDDSDDEEASQDQEPAEELKQAPAAASPFSLEASPATPITEEHRPEERVPFGFTPEGYAEDRREWQKMLRKKA